MLTNDENRWKLSLKWQSVPVSVPQMVVNAWTAGRVHKFASEWTDY